MSSNNTYIITEHQHSKFKPTYLYIKQHSITGLKYFGKTTKNNPHKYNGSGKYWTKHLKKHGKQVNTLWVKLFTDINQLVSTALTLSDLYDITESDYWANFKPENGLDGGSTSENATKRTKEGKNPFSGGSIQSKTCKKLVSENKHNFQGSFMNEYLLSNNIHPSQNPINAERTSKREKEKIANGTHHFISPEFKQSQSKKQKEKVINGTHHLLSGEIQKQSVIKQLANGTHNSQIKVCCIYCHKCLDISNFGRYHGNMCKHKP